LDSKVSIDGCHTKELQGGCEGEKPGILFTVLPQPSQCILTLSTTAFTSFCNSLINKRQLERKNERGKKKTGVLDSQPMAAPDSINENKDVPCSCRWMASQKKQTTTKKSIIISIIKVLVHWKFSLIPQSISQGKNKFCHFD
jgi:hypothetical protein